jgi:hypothetical protein
MAYFYLEIDLTYHVRIIKYKMRLIGPFFEISSFLEKGFFTNGFKQ